MKKYILYTSLLALTACFQDLEQNPPYDYPAEYIPTYNPKKISFSFNDSTKDESNYRIPVQPVGNITFTDGKKGKAYQGAADTYLLLTPSSARFPGDISVKDTIAQLGSFTVAFWMNSPQVTKGTGIFSLSNTKKFWGNLDIFLDGNSTEGEGRFKMHLYNGTKENWVETKIPNTIGDWVFMTFRYNSLTNELSIFRNAEKVFTRTLTGWGGIQYNDAGSIVIGNFQFQTNPSLTTAAKAQGWAQPFLGKLDAFAFYNKALTDEQIKTLQNE